jgi:hypothetical protein
MGRRGSAPKSLSALPLIFCFFVFGVLVLSWGCARPSGILHRSGAGSQASGQELPFHPQQNPGRAAVESGVPELRPDPNLANGLPFRVASHPRTLPSGTLLTVELGGSLSPARVRSGEVFAASVAGPVTIDGETIIESGTAVIGRIESAQAAGPQPRDAPRAGLRPGYVRLVLSAILVDGQQIPLQTASLFARGSLRRGTSALADAPITPQPENARVQKGRLLTFRLTAPLTLDVSSSMASRRDVAPSKE